MAVCLQKERAGEQAGRHGDRWGRGDCPLVFYMRIGFMRPASRDC